MTSHAEPFCDLELARRLESAEGAGSAEFVRTRARLDVSSRAVVERVASAWLMYDGAESPLTQSFGLGLFETVSDEQIEVATRFFHERGAPAAHEISPLAPDELLERLQDRGYRAIEWTSVMFRPLARQSIQELMPGSFMHGSQITVRRIDSSPETNEVEPSESQADHWSQTAASGWRDVAPQLVSFLQEIGTVNAQRPDAACFLAERGGVAVAAGLLSVHEGVALLAGASTIPEFRRQGAQNELLRARLSYAGEQDCDLAMMCARPGSDSQRNAERNGFRIAYTRAKWLLPPAD